MSSTSVVPLGSSTSWPRVDSTTAVPAPPPAAAPMAAPLLPPMIAPTTAPPAAGMPIFFASSALVERAVLENRASMGYVLRRQLTSGSNLRRVSPGPSPFPTPRPGRRRRGQRHRWEHGGAIAHEGLSQFGPDGSSTRLVAELTRVRASSTLVVHGNADLAKLRPWAERPRLSSLIRMSAISLRATVLVTRGWAKHFMTSGVRDSVPSTSAPSFRVS